MLFETPQLSRKSGHSRSNTKRTVMDKDRFALQEWNKFHTKFSTKSMYRWKLFMNVKRGAKYH